ncbi:MAG: prepilin peptidase [Candidatus Bathyarchaeota archaeon]|nr:prepilin peptidase [Candidatus Bathyarchaeota archaeon]
MELFQVLSAARITLSLAILVYASWSDYKTREVTNRAWAVYAPVALLLMLTEICLYDAAKLLPYFISFAVTAALALLLFYTGAFGGADSKAFMCIALALPFYPEGLLTPIIATVISPLAQNLFPLTIFNNSVLFAAASGVYMLLRNVAWRIRTRHRLFEDNLAAESLWKKFAVLITGHKFPIDKLQKTWHLYPMEDVEDEEASPKRKLVIIPNDEHRNQIVERLAKAVETGKISADVWATPGLPMLIFVTAALIAALLFGDILWLIITFLVG